MCTHSSFKIETCISTNSLVNFCVLTKVVYQSETLSPVLASLSRTAELALRLKITGEKMASENWQVVLSLIKIKKKITFR